MDDSTCSFNLLVFSFYLFFFFCLCFVFVFLVFGSFFISYRSSFIKINTNKNKILYKTNKLGHFSSFLKLRSVIRGAFNKFPDLFCIFRIVVDSWQFSILLLYILWDDWPIFMISALNEQLQQELEYTLLKSDCHSWWISKMQSGREDTLQERHAKKFCFKLEKNATETYGMLQTAFRPYCMNRASVFEWHKRFKEGRESVRDDERFWRSKEVNTPELIGQRVTMLRF